MMAMQINIARFELVYGHSVARQKLQFYANETQRYLKSGLESFSSGTFVIPIAAKISILNQV